MSEPNDKDRQDIAAAIPDPPSKLDAMAKAQGLEREPDESDEQLGQRILETANRCSPLASEISDGDKEVSTLMSEILYPGDRSIYAVFKRSGDRNGCVELIATATTEAIAKDIQSRVHDGETFVKPIQLYGDHRTLLPSESKI